MSILVLKKFTINYNVTSSQDDVVHIVGRQAGVLGFLLSIAKIDPTTQLRVNSERVEFQQSSFFGQQTLTAPIPAVTGILGGYTKPKALLYLTIASVFTGIYLAVAIKLIAPFLVGLVIGAIFFIFYILKKDMSLMIQNGGDKMWGLTFQRSVIENVGIDINQVREAVALINDRILAVHRNA